MPERGGQEDTSEAAGSSEWEVRDGRVVSALGPAERPGGRAEPRVRGIAELMDEFRREIEAEEDLPDGGVLGGEEEEPSRPGPDLRAQARQDEATQ